MESRREFIRKSLLLSGAAGLSTMLPASIQRALAIDPKLGSSFLDAEHIVILMQENRSFDHCFGTLQGVRGFNDPRAITLPDQKPVWMQTNATGETYVPFRLNIKDSKVTWMGDLPHSRASQVDAYNRGKYDQWLTAKRSGNKKYSDMPLTLGHYTREDLPFNYAMADAFTVCDQNFCSAMTSTTPNRSFFWTGKVSYQLDGLQKVNIRNDDFSYGKLPWKAFPELLEENDISWKFYQNDLSCGGGYKGEERAWLANFGCNLLEFFAAYNVKFSSRYVKNLQKLIETLPGEINKLQEASPSSDAAATKIKKDLEKKLTALDNAASELKIWSQEAYEKLSDQQKHLFKNAFVTNIGDPDYRDVTTLNYTDEGTKRELTVPKGDVLHQFRTDVNTGKLPAVSWLAGPQNFSDHPSAPWYGAWYVSEILDILTKNPEVWKKTIFITTYDENDGYFDHVPPFSIPDAKIPETGLVSKGIDTEIEYVRLANELKQGIPEKAAREAPIGLGFRVPMLIASPWSRGGRVCSEVFDHTSTLQFLETFFNKKLNKNLHIENISNWRRAICGDLTSVFAPYKGEKADKINFLQRNDFVEDIYNAKFKAEPNGFKKLTEADVAGFIQDPINQHVMSQQEKGIRPSCALPYELHVNGKLSADQQSFEISFGAGDTVFGAKSAGAPFTVVAPGKFQDALSKAGAEVYRNWSFGVVAGDELTYKWPVGAFEGSKYQLLVNGPNGFFRSFKGLAKEASINIHAEYEKAGLKLSGNVLLKITNQNRSKTYTILVEDNGYGNSAVKNGIKPGQTLAVVIAAAKSHGWYDASVRIEGSPDFEQRFAGRVETGAESFSDPVMGRSPK
ncbi:phospholipase C [Pedobacter steynii]|uniref:phospholipase C n=1 Tax=Pedobacter steynii TaxID=430522 RepID=A0A1H0LA63_9SPHI|nr:phospholipase C, phosphocholine-specific [Pedobacter steynii]NQX43456.1 phospholipase C, phosphocholine-specific [Pedobacter steynii]SDO65015.1 phospholipase C [Pedobacter steynii]